MIVAVIPLLMKPRFTIRLLLVVIAAIFCSLVGAKEVYRRGMLSKFRESIERSDLCGANDVLREAQSKGLANDWADAEFQRAAANGDWHTLLCMDVCMNLSRPINGGQTAMMYMAKRGDHSAVKNLLLRYDVDVEVLDSKGRTAADIALDNGYPAIASLIDVYAHDDWAKIKKSKHRLRDLQLDTWNNELAELLRRDEYAAFASSFVWMPESFGDISWFLITERVAIGINNSRGSQHMPWYIDEHILN